MNDPKLLFLFLIIVIAALYVYRDNINAFLNKRKKTRTAADDPLDRVNTATDPEELRELSASHESIGNVYRDKKDWDAALSSYKKCLVVREKLAAATPKNTEFQRALSSIFSSLGTVYANRAQLVEALRYFKAALDIDQKLVTKDPNVQLWQKDLEISRRNVAATEDKLHIGNKNEEAKSS